MKKRFQTLILIIVLSSYAPATWAWHDETHVAIAKVAGYAKWFNATGADMIKVKAGNIERRNHYVNNPRDTIVTPEMVMEQVEKYDTTGDRIGRLYGSIIAAVRNYIKVHKAGKYAEYHLAFAAHYIGDLTQPFHNTVYNKYNQTHHNKVDGIINDDVLNRLDHIKLYEINISSEQDLAREIARIANLAKDLGYQMEDENRLLTKAEAYRQISHSASLFKALLKYVDQKKK